MKNAHTPFRGPRNQPLPIAFQFIAAVVCSLCLFGHLDTLGLVGPDEPRYAAVAREMAEGGDWVTPHLNSRPWFEKPVLYYWSAAGAFRTFGVNEFSARLPSALAALLAALALGWAAWRFYGAATAWAAMLIFSTCFGVIGFARAAGPDMLFGGTLAAAMAAGSGLIWNAREKNLTRGRTGALLRVAFGAFLGVATLAKGPAAIALAGGSVGAWALVTGRWRETLRLMHPLSVLSFCVTALPWYVLCGARNPDFMRTFFISHNVERYLTPVFRHEQPVWFFGPVLLLGLLPWTALLAALTSDIAELWAEPRARYSPALFFACWSIFPVVFFSFSKSKLPGYVLPALPPLALLLTRSFTRRIERAIPSSTWLAAGIGATFVTLGASAGYWVRRLPPESGLAERSAVLPWLALAMVGGLGVALLGLWRPWVALLVAATLTAGLLEGVNQRVLPRLDPYLSPRAAARSALTRPMAKDTISVFRLHRAWHYGLNFYLHRELPEWNPQLQGLQWVYTNAAGLTELKRHSKRVTLVERASPAAWLVRVEP